MKNISCRTFAIPRSGGRAPFRFAVRERDDGGTEVVRISPNDKTQYHQALKPEDSNDWLIMRDGRTVSRVASFIGGRPDESAEAFTPEQITYFLIKADREANLEPDPYRWERPSL